MNFKSPSRWCGDGGRESCRTRNINPRLDCKEKGTIYTYNLERTAPFGDMGLGLLLCSLIEEKSRAHADWLVATHETRLFYRRFVAVCSCSAEIKSLSLSLYLRLHVSLCLIGTVPTGPVVCAERRCQSIMKPQPTSAKKGFRRSPQGCPCVYRFDLGFSALQRMQRFCCC